MTDPPPEVLALAERRAQARQARDFAVADRLRGQLADLGWLVSDAGQDFSLRPAPPYEVLPGPDAVPAGTSGQPCLASVALLVDGYPDDLRDCVTALLAVAPAGVRIIALDCGNVSGAGDVLHELAVASGERVAAWHVAASKGWGVARNALLRADTAPVHVLMETSTILTGDAISPLLAELADPDVVAAGWRGADPDPDLRSFHDAGPGEVTALLSYLMAVRTAAALEVGGLPPGAKYYRNADLEFSLRLGKLGKLVVPDQSLPVRQATHRGYHDADPQYREAESRRNYRRVLDLLRAKDQP
jgi:hypothetical protein